ncbi:hypothetical protein, partial [Micromonospora zamorensis]|uniref:hypothetical protein n=1 Tax=Micromonospora zamorensis TaxID=709883 RepID=UPI0033B5B126
MRTPLSTSVVEAAALTAARAVGVLGSPSCSRRSIVAVVPPSVTVAASNPIETISERVCRTGRVCPAGCVVRGTGAGTVDGAGRFTGLVRTPGAVVGSTGVAAGSAAATTGATVDTMGATVGAVSDTAGRAGAAA